MAKRQFFMNKLESLTGQQSEISSTLADIRLEERTASQERTEGDLTKRARRDDASGINSEIYGTTVQARNPLMGPLQQPLGQPSHNQGCRPTRESAAVSMVEEHNASSVERVAGENFIPDGNEDISEGKIATRHTCSPLNQN